MKTWRIRFGRTTRIILLPLLLLLFIVLQAYGATPGQQLWVRRYNGPGNSDDYAYAIAVDSSGNVYVTGYSAGSGTGTDYLTIKYDSAGNKKWVKRYNGPGNDFDVGIAIALDSSGNVYVTGYSTGSSTGYDYATIKYTSIGKKKWVKRYNGPGNGNDEARAIALDSSGNVYVTGYSTGSGTGYDYATIKYTSTGKKSGSSATTAQEMAMTKPTPSPLTPVAMSMLRVTALAPALLRTTPPSNTTPLAKKVDQALQRPRKWH